MILATSMAHIYYSQRTGSNENLEGLPLVEVVELLVRVFDHLCADGYFAEALGYDCVDAGRVEGLLRDVEMEMLLAIRKKLLWPIHKYSSKYSEDDFFDVIEFLFQNVSKPVDGSYHDYSNCGMHWSTFNKKAGRNEYRERVNVVLSHYVKRFELSTTGEILHLPEQGFEQIFAADVPSTDEKITKRVEAAMLRYRRHGSTIDDRRQAVRDLADVLEYLRPKVQTLLTNQDERDLFNLANNFGVRHHNDKQKTGYDQAFWLSWMFYYYLATIHVVLRKLGLESKE